MELFKKLWSWMNEHRIFVLLLIFVIGGFFLRIYRLGSRSLWLDEAQSAVFARAFLKNGWPVIEGRVWTKAILHTGFVAVSFASFGVSEAVGRFPSVLFGVFSIPLSFFLGKRMKNDRTGVLLAFFVAFATVEITWSRQLRFYQQLQFFFLLSLFFMDRFMDSTSWKDFSVLVFSALCMTQSHGRLGYLLVAPLGVWFIVEKGGWVKKKLLNPRSSRVRDWLGFTVFVVLVVFFLYLGQDIIMEKISEGYHHVLTHERNWFFNYITYFRNDLGYLFLLAIPGALLATVERKRNLAYIFAFLFPFLMLSYRTYAYQARHVFALIPLILAFSTCTLDYIFERIRSAISEFSSPFKSDYLIPSLIIIAVIVSSSTAFTFAPQPYYDPGPTAPQGEFRPIHAPIEENWSENDTLATTIPPVTNFYLDEEKYRPYYRIDSWGWPYCRWLGSVSEIKKLENQGQVWVVVDAMFRYRILDRKGGNLEKLLRYVQDNYELDERGRGAWLYSYRREK